MLDRVLGYSDHDSCLLPYATFRVFGSKCMAEVKGFGAAKWRHCGLVSDLLKRRDGGSGFRLSFTRPPILSPGKGMGYPATQDCIRRDSELWVSGLGGKSLHTCLQRHGAAPAYSVFWFLKESCWRGHMPQMIRRKPREVPMAPPTIPAAFPTRNSGPVA